MLKNYSKKLVVQIVGAFMILFVIGVLIFMTYFNVENVEVRESAHYTEEEISEMVLTGVFSSNAFLAPIFCTKEVDNIAFVDKFVVTRTSHNSIIVSVHEKKAVGCFLYLGSYIYFDRNGVFVESSGDKHENVPFYKDVSVKYIIEGEKIPIKNKNMVEDSVMLAAIFEKNDTQPDYVGINENNQIYLVYEEVTVLLGKNSYLEDKVARMLAILPLIEGKKGVLHLESVTDTVKTITFEQDEEQLKEEQAEAEWTGGYDENGTYTGDGEYDADGNYVGPMPESDVSEEDEETYLDESEYTDSYNDYNDDSYDSYYDSYDYNYDSYDDGSYDDYGYDDYSYNDYSYDDYSYNDYSYDSYDYSDYSYDYDSDYGNYGW